MLVSGRINCAVQFCTALPSCANLAGPVRQFLHANCRTGRPALTCQNLHIQACAHSTSLHQLAETELLQACRPVCRRRACAFSFANLHSAGSPARRGFTPCTAVQIYCNFCLVSPKVHFYLGNPLFCYDDKKKFDADISFQVISNVFHCKILISVSNIGNFGSFSNVHSSYMSKFEQIRNQDIFETFEFSLKDSVLDYILPIRRHLKATTFNQAKLIRK